MGSQSRSNLYTLVIKSDNGESFNYLAKENGVDDFDIYLNSVKGGGGAYKAEVTSAILSATDISAQNLLFGQETGVQWCIEAGRSSAKITWKRNLKKGMKHVLGQMTMDEHPSAPSEMLSICSAVLNQEASRTNAIQEKCDSLEKENAELRRVATEAVEARQLIEDDLISKFTLLLNEKKAKVRALKELLAERRDQDLDGAADTSGGGGEPDAAGSAADRPPSEAADRSDSDPYDQETDVDSGPEEPPDEPGPSRVAQLPPPANDSLELDCDDFVGPPPVRPKRPAPETEGAPPPPDKRRLADSDDLLDIV